MAILTDPSVALREEGRYRRPRPLLMLAPLFPVAALVVALVVIASAQAGTPDGQARGIGATSQGNYAAVAGLTCVPAPGGWSAGPSLPTPLVRAVGAYFQDNGNFYSIGGRTADSAGSDFQHVLEYAPSTNTWVQKSVTLPDDSTSNMACAVLTSGGTSYIYCVGGSFATGTTATSRVFQYDPVTDTVTVLSSDDWPGDTAGTILPGGFAVANNKLYILGGFNINVASTTQIWEFDPSAAAGSRWTQKVDTPEGIMYGATATIGGIIYVGGASDYSGGTVVDTTNSFSFDPVANSIGTIMTIPRATGETRAVVADDQMLVLGGGRIPPNPSNEIDNYHPTINMWLKATTFVTPRRNFPADSDPATGRIWLAGGYASDGVTPLDSMEIFTPPVICPTDTPTPTDTEVPTDTAIPSATDTPVGTPTSCTIQFSDVPEGSTFYPYIHCLACLGIISGYADGTFKPNSDVTRGQLSKIVSNAAGFDDDQTTQMFQDVPVGSTFFTVIGRLASRGYISGYACGGSGEPCNPPGNLPYFRPNNNATRGQISKIVSNAAGFEDPPTAQQFVDVPEGSTYYTYTYRLVTRNVMGGYPCGTPPAGACVPPGNLPYFLPNNNATRGQTSKIVSNTFFPECDIPSHGGK